MGTVFGDAEYKASITLIKFFAGLLPTGVAAFVLGVVGELPTEAVWPVVVMVVVSGVYRAIRNISKFKGPISLP